MHQSALGKKALEQLRYFLEDLKDASYRTLLLDTEVIPILTDFLLTCDENKQIAILCSLDWLNHFIDFFREDFLAVLDRARSLHLENQQNNSLGIVEESKGDPASQQLIVEETKQDQGLMFQSSSNANNNLLTIDTGNSNNNYQQNNGLNLNDLRKNKTLYLDVNTNSLLRKMYTK